MSSAKAVTKQIACQSEISGYRLRMLAELCRAIGLLQVIDKGGNVSSATSLFRITLIERTSSENVREMSEKKISVGAT